MTTKNVSMMKLTFEQAREILTRLHFWSGLFYREAEDRAFDFPLIQLTKGLTEKRLVKLDSDSVDVFERLLIYERDPVVLWRMSMGLQNHKISLLQAVVKRFPEQKDKLKCFRLVNG